MKFGPRRPERRARRHRGAFDPPGRARAQERHADRAGGSGRAQGRRRQGNRGGAARAGRRVGRPGRRRYRRGRDRARACAPTAPSPDAAICSPKRAGVLVVDKDAIDRLNRIDEAVTLATLPAFKPVVEGEMIATVKIIPFAVAGDARDQAVAEAAKAKPVIRVAPYKVRKIGIVSTLLPGLAPKVVEKTLKITATRIAPAGATIVAERRVPHEQAALARAIDEVLQSRRRAGDRVRRFGHRRPARRHPGGDRSGRRRDRAFRHAGRSRQSDADRPLARAGGDRRAGLRAQSRRKTASTGC